MSAQQLKKATITVLEGSKANTVITVLFNPTEYTFERTNAYKSTPVPGLTSPLVHFINGECDTLSMELFLDDYTDPNGPQPERRENEPVLTKLREISDLLNIDRRLHAPPPVRFNWGPFEFVAVLEKLGRKVTLFHPDGTPARATLSVTFREYRTLKEQLERPRRESADKSKRRQVIGRETLPLIAQREYGDVAHWRLIADQNDLDDPRAVAAGDWLLLPPLDETNGPRIAIR